MEEKYLLFKKGFYLFKKYLLFTFICLSACYFLLFFSFSSYFHLSVPFFIPHLSFRTSYFPSLASFLPCPPSVPSSHSPPPPPAPHPLTPASLPPQVVQRIKAVSNETRLLVLDPEADKYYKAKNIVVRGSQSNVITKSSVRAPPSPPPPEPPATNGHHQDDADARSVSSAASSSAASEASTQPQVRQRAA